MRKILFTLIMIALFTCPAMAQRYRGFQLFIVDEFGNAVTNIDQIEIQDAGTTTTSTIYGDRAGSVSVTNPITTTSTNSTFDQSLGLVRWFQAAASFKVVVTESGASQSLTIDNMTSEVSMFPFFANYIGEAATLQTTDDADLDIGTGDDFVHDWDNDNSRYIIYPAADGGRLDFGKAAVHTDIYWHTGAAITSDYVLFDEGSAVVDFIDVDLMIDDEAILYLGSGNDISFDYDSSGNDLDVLSAGDLDLISWGATGAGYDQEWWGGTAGDKILLDVSENELYFTDVDIMFDDNGDLIFGTGEDWVVDSDTDKRLDFLPALTTDDAIFAIGDADHTSDFYIYGKETNEGILFDSSGAVWSFGFADNYGVDVVFYGDTASQKAWWDCSGDEWFFGADAEGVDVTFYGDITGCYAKWDENGGTNGMLLVEGADIALGDADLILFGDALGTGDIKMYATGTNFIIDGVVADTGTVAIGVTDHGLDFKLWAATAAEGILWDASDEALEFTGANITLDAASVLTLGETVNADVVVTDAATYTVLAANSGKVHLIGDLTQNTTINLPAEADGLYYKFIYIGGAADAHDHTIDSESNDNHFIGGVAFIDSDAGAGADEIHAGVFSDGNSNSILTLNNLTVGSWIEVHCDGTDWYLTGLVLSDTVPTLTDQS